MKISVFNTKRIPGAKRFSDVQNPELLERMGSIDTFDGTDLEDALTRTWDTDAHFVMYHAQAGDDRLFLRANKGPFVSELEQQGGNVVVGVLVFDHDLPKLEDGSKQEWSADSLESFLGDLFEAVGNSNLEPTAWYSTLHGSRLVYVLDEPVGPQIAEAMMRGIMTAFGKEGIELDPACKDWTRLFRLPNVNREGYGQFTSRVEIDMDMTLAVADCPMGEVESANISATIDEYSGDKPDPDECRALLKEKRDNGREYQSELLKMAKKLLIGRDSYDVIFDHKPMVKGDTNWNDQVFRLTGQLVGMMAREPVATPEGLYALLHEGISQLQDREMNGADESDWYELTWDHIVRNWNGEQEQIEAQLQVEREAQAEAVEQRLTIVDKLRAVQPDLVPEDDAEAAEWLIERSIATNGKNHYVLRSDGSYNLQPCSNSTLVPTIRDLEVQHLIPTTELRGKNVVSKNSQEIINECAIPVVEVQPSVLRDMATIEGPKGARKLFVPIHTLNPKLKPAFDSRVDEWLQHFAGENYELLVEWLSHSLDVRRPICALNLYGAANSGKGMLALGLAECFETEATNSSEVFGQWNRGLLDTPVVVCDEGLPQSGGNGLTVDQAFRTLVTGGKIRIRQMNTDYFAAELFPRIMFTSNDKDLISAIVGHRDLTDEDVHAIEMRLLSMEVQTAARNHLTSKGGFAWTAGWVGVQQASDYTIANHIKWLYDHREESQRGTGRLLVEGEVGSRLVADEQVKSRDAEMVLRAIVKLVDQSHGGQNARRMHVHQGRIWTTPNDIVEYVEENLSAPGRGLTISHARRVLGNFSAIEDKDLDADGRSTKKSTPKGSTVRKRWTEMDVPHIYQRALEFGMNTDQLERILQDQPGGGAIIKSLNE